MPKIMRGEAEIVAMAGQKGRRDHFHQYGRPRNGHCSGRGGYRNWADFTFSAPNAMRAGGLTTSFAAVPAVREIRALPGFFFPWRMICCVFSAGSALPASWRRLGMEEGEPIEHNLISRAIENAQSQGGRAQLRYSKAASRI